MQKDRRTLGERVSDGVAKFGGSWKFIFFATFFLTSWISFNSLDFFDPWIFDPAPFILLNLLLSCIAAFQAPFILMSQHRAEQKQDEAYRTLFAEIKHLVEADLEATKESQGIEKRIGIRLVRIEEVVNLVHEKMKHDSNSG